MTARSARAASLAPTDASDNGRVSQTRSGYRSTAGGLVGALIVSVALMALVALITVLHSRGTDDPTPPYDYSGDLTSAREGAPFEVLAPSSLPDGWYATSADSTKTGPVFTWHLGLITDQDEYVGLDQSNEASTSFIAASTKADQPGDPVEIDGQTWQTLTSGEETALVLVSRGSMPVSTVVTGTASEDELVDFAGSLTTS
jgi:hypothetical protein